MVEIKFKLPFCNGVTPRESGSFTWNGIAKKKHTQLELTVHGIEFSWSFSQFQRSIAESKIDEQVKENMFEADSCQRNTYIGSMLYQQFDYLLAHRYT